MSELGAFASPHVSKDTQHMQTRGGSWALLVGPLVKGDVGSVFRDAADWHFQGASPMSIPLLV